MPLFLDTSALVKAYVSEPGTSVMRELLARPEFRDSLFVAGHVELEVVTTIAKKARKKIFKRSGQYQDP